MGRPMESLRRHFSTSEISASAGKINGRNKNLNGCDISSDQHNDDPFKCSWSSDLREQYKARQKRNHIKFPENYVSIRVYQDSALPLKKSMKNKNIRK